MCNVIGTYTLELITRTSISDKSDARIVCDVEGMRNRCDS